MKEIILAVRRQNIANDGEAARSPSLPQPLVSGTVFLGMQAPPAR
jgi:hypothetical protein